MKAATAYIQLNNLVHNLGIVRTKTANSRVWATIKANGYGHGLLTVANTLAFHADGFGVARLEEALAIRADSIETPILLLEGFYAAKDLSLLVKHQLQTAVHCIEQLEALEQAILVRPLRVWLKIDSGMHRIGVRPENVNMFIKRLNACPNVAKPLHFMSHFSCADELENSVTQKQMIVFFDAIAGQKGYRSLAASSGCFFWPKSHLDWVRPGICLYGISSVSSITSKILGLKPVMTMTSSLIAIKKIKKRESVGYGGRWIAENDTSIGVVAIGYGDGYPYVAPDGTPVIINGRRVPLVGRISMDMLTIDLGSYSQDCVGDEVILWGENLPVEEVAAHIGTIGYELVTSITSRVNLVYT
ncbi:alanine racemase [Candidatus Enterovibrio altilux]|uniref:Alanine racemase n=1 Tax=Candidatus Enterovibrio altilux TaxID=1927128 RepID=A0A291BBJ2_9GAMM|nr:alanine racemase [Candidatus Enterovibrio luxaltus]ATF10367.1 Alanine racemase [Candidatus Enterovibrio luxaltus]